MPVPVAYTKVPITLGAKFVPDVAAEVIAYLDAPNTSGRIVDYDYAAWKRRQAFKDGAAPRITMGTIESADNLMAQWFRLGGDYMNKAFLYFDERQHDAPWELVPDDTTFIGADPVENWDVYENMSQLWYHFRDTNFGPARVNKVLHQVLPDLMPIFDSFLEGIYEGRSVKKEVIAARKSKRPDYMWPKGGDTFLWEPFRVDMAKLSEDDIAHIRAGIKSVPCANTTKIDGHPANVWAADNLSLVRIIDMVAWRAGGGAR